MIDIKNIEAEAKAEIVKENTAKVKTALLKKFRDLQTARNIVLNIERDIEDLKASIIDGSFVG
jgi:hypothetical protein